MISGNRKGFTLIEITMVLVIIGMLSIMFLRWSRSATDDMTVKQEYLNAYIFEKGIKLSLIGILDSFEGVCGNIPGDGQASFGWGWGSASCANTSPLPTAAGNTIVYSVNFGSLSAAAATSLQNTIASSFAPMCTVNTTTATSMTLFCGSTFSDLKYDTSGGLVATYHTPGTDFNSLDTPVPVLSVTRKYAEGNAQETKTYRLSLADVLQQRNAYTTSKMENVGKVLKNLYNTKLTLETINTAPGGLNNVDDELSPWFWEGFGDDGALATTTVCIKNAATGVCDNLNTNNIWRSTAGDALLWRRLITGRLNGDYKYTVDGYGNALRIIPIISQCAGTNMALCTPSAPQVPSQPYSGASVKPPYATLIYNRVTSGGINCADTSTQAPSSCRYSIVY